METGRWSLVESSAAILSFKSGGATSTTTTIPKDKDRDQPDRYLAGARVARDTSCAAAQLCDFGGHLP